jgi:hypothetical protein
LWTDKDGYKHLSLVRNDDPDDAAPSGVLCDPPDLRELDWDAIIKALQNRLTERGLTDWKAVQASQNGITSTIVSILKPQIIQLYRSMEAKND